MVLAIPALRCFLIVSFLSLGLVLKGQNKFEAEFAQGMVVLRLCISPETNSRLKFELIPIYTDGRKLDTVGTFVVGWKEDVYKATLAQMHRSVWKNYKDSADTILFKNLDAQLQGSFSSIYKAFKEKTSEQFANVSYGLSFADQSLYDEYLQELSNVQDTIRLAKRVLDFRVKKDIENSKIPTSKLDSLRSILSSLNKIFDKNGINKNESIDKAAIHQITKSLDIFSATFIPKPDEYLQIYNRFLSYDTSHLNKKIDSLGINEEFLKGVLRRIDIRRQSHLHLIGDANVVSSFKNANANQVNAGFGLLAVKPGYSEFFGVITVAQGQEDSTYDYGPSVLVPGVRRFSLLTSFRQYSLNRYSHSAFLRRFGFGLDVNITPYRWVKDTSVKAIPFAVNVLFPFYFVHQSKPGEDYSISTDIGMSVRYIGGDLSKNQIEQFLGNGRRWYVGPIAGINIKYNALRAQFHAPLFFAKDEKSVKGLTNGQVFASIGILANLTGDLGKVFKAKN